MIDLIVATCSSSPGFHYTTSLRAPSPLIIKALVRLSAYSEKEKLVLLNHLCFLSRGSRPLEHYIGQESENATTEHGSVISSEKHSGIFGAWS